MKQATTPSSLTYPTAWIELPDSRDLRPSRYVFGRPCDVWQADDLSEVRPAFDRVEAHQQAGRYVAGLITYEAAPAFDSAFKTPPRSVLPLVWFAAFDQPLTEIPNHIPLSIPPRPPRLLMPEEEYTRAVRKALLHIRAGDIYQVNYTVRAELDLELYEDSSLQSYALFRTLLAAVPMPHAAFINTRNEQIISLSPELFLRRRGSIIETRPMKGTAPRYPSWEEDETARLALAADEKNRAENVMIVDLMRNDLGRICRAGSVHVPELWRVDRFPTVHQMTSLVRGELCAGTSLFDIFAATFPPGSVTGAPKIRACEIIADLEPQPRGIYCGSIGLFFPNGDFECNVAIRTLSIHCSPHPPHPSALLGIGSGIVADSDPAAEWKETVLKSQFITRRPQAFSLYETIRYQPSLPFEDLLGHLRRLRQSCRYFGRPFPVKDLLKALRKLREELGANPARIRLDLDEEKITIRTEHANLSWPERGFTVMIADERVNSEDFRLYHKTTLRPERYEILNKARERSAQECLFLNTREEVTEGAISNVLIKQKGQWLTPALHCGLLPGVRREKLLRSGRCIEAIISKNGLMQAEEIRMVNAVRGEGIVEKIIDSRGEILYQRGRE